MSNTTKTPRKSAKTRKNVKKNTQPKTMKIGTAARTLLGKKDINPKRGFSGQLGNVNVSVRTTTRGKVEITVSQSKNVKVQGEFGTTRQRVTTPLIRLTGLDASQLRNNVITMRDTRKGSQKKATRKTTTRVKRTAPAPEQTQTPASFSTFNGGFCS